MIHGVELLFDGLNEHAQNRAIHVVEDGSLPSESRARKSDSQPKTRESDVIRQSLRSSQQSAFQPLFGGALRDHRTAE